jgi:hypothetical protein
MSALNACVCVCVFQSLEERDKLMALLVQYNMTYYYPD